MILTTLGSVLSFNPCFNGSLSASLPVPILCRRIYSVSILVLMEAFRRDESALRNPVLFSQVSILVLMEAFRREDLSINKKMSGISFNPCFNGSLSASFEGQSPEIRIGFQSLF